MFDKTYEHRLAAWVAVRDSLEQSKDPIQDVIDIYNTAPRVSIHIDPWDQKSWPGPWELILENQYCEFACVLGMCYSLQLTDRFKGSDFEIHISIDYNESATYYLLYVDDYVVGYRDGTYITRDDLPSKLIIQKQYCMSNMQ